ncbi:protein FAM43B [Brienomyrus brachyistius]|uniref:protein FAM43B n=1 Tax=Brienomyrus brachyistius TaxID=42636 RepID=UPI0020B2B8CF|nr:protein FAM43B [Brienomyrus brachyistius]
MLPWRRSKFVLVEDETKGKPKSLTAGLTYHSIISSLVRSCPDLLPDYAFERLGSVFRTKRQKVELNKDEPTYTVRYLGSTVTLNAKGEGCTEEAVAKIWSKSDYGGQSTKMKLTVGLQGIRLSHDKASKKLGNLFVLHRITYCAADSRRPKIFAWIYRHQIKNKAVVLRCHAVLVTKPEKARAMAINLYQTSTAAFNEFKRFKRQNDFRHCQQQLLGGDMVPGMPLRRVLNGQCHYRPPLDSSPGVYRLGSITEEEEEGDKEENERDVNKVDKERVQSGPSNISSHDRDLGKIVNRLDACSLGSIRCLARQFSIRRLL